MLVVIDVIDTFWKYFLVSFHSSDRGRLGWYVSRSRFGASTFRRAMSAWGVTKTYVTWLITFTIMTKRTLTAQLPDCSFLEVILYTLELEKLHVHCAKLIILQYTYSHSKRRPRCRPLTMCRYILVLEPVKSCSQFSCHWQVHLKMSGFVIGVSRRNPWWTRTATGPPYQGI